MANVALVPALAKVLLSIAWSDDELHPEEEATIKEVIGLLPDLSAREWAAVELYMVAPIGPAEREELLRNLLLTIRGTDDRRIALQAVDALIGADGMVTPGEEEAARAVRTALAALNVSPLGAMGRSLGGAFRGTPGRERNLELWRTNPVLYALEAGGRANTGDPQLVLASLAAGIMAQVVRNSSADAEAERPVLVRALSENWGLDQRTAELTANAALALARRNVDYHRISRELVPRTSEAQRVALLDTLFSIANAADQVAPSEIDEIRVIAERLQLHREQFIAAKLKIPSAERGGL